MPQMGMTFFPPGCRGGNIRIAVKGAKKAPLWKVPCQPGLLLDTVLSIFSVAYPYLRGKCQFRAGLCQFCARKTDYEIYQEKSDERYFVKHIIEYS